MVEMTVIDDGRCSKFIAENSIWCPEMETRRRKGGNDGLDVEQSDGRVKDSGR